MPTRFASHRAIGTLPPDQQRARTDRDRGTARQRGYTAEWSRASRDFLREHPLCRMCEAKGLVVPATLTDHIIPHRGDRRLFWDRTNWQPLCRPCHSGEKQRIEAREG